MTPRLDRDRADRWSPAPAEPTPREEAGPRQLDLDEDDSESTNDEGRHTRWQFSQ
jgi:hypothetical protein